MILILGGCLIGAGCKGLLDKWLRKSRSQVIIQV